MDKKILILTHGTQVWADNLEAMFKDIGNTAQTISLRHGGTFPEDIELYDAVVVLGGGMGLYERDEYPWLKEELLHLEKALKLDVPVLGICLGAQMLAHIHGGEVKKGEHGMSVGFHRIRIIENDFVFGRELDSIPVCKWHGDHFTMPNSATLIATSKPYSNQAVKFSDDVYGVQFHPEITPCRILKWYGESADKLPDNAPTLEQFVEDGKTYIPASHDWLKLFFCRLLDK
jgi:GMP synthase-like glutamine amidotransferase